MDEILLRRSHRWLLVAYKMLTLLPQSCGWQSWGMGSSSAAERTDFNGEGTCVCVIIVRKFPPRSALLLLLPTMILNVSLCIGKWCEHVEESGEKLQFTQWTAVAGHGWEEMKNTKKKKRKFSFFSVSLLQISDHSIKCVKPHESGRMIACGCANGSVHLMEVSENMSHSAKNDKAILNTVSITFLRWLDVAEREKMGWLVVTSKKRKERKKVDGNSFAHAATSETLKQSSLGPWKCNKLFIFMRLPLPLRSFFFSFFACADVGPWRQTRENPRRKITWN